MHSPCWFRPQSVGHTSRFRRSQSATMSTGWHKRPLSCNPYRQTLSYRHTCQAWVRHGWRPGDEHGRLLILSSTSTLYPPVLQRQVGHTDHDWAAMPVGRGFPSYLLVVMLATFPVTRMTIRPTPAGVWNRQAMSHTKQ